MEWCLSRRQDYWNGLRIEQVLFDARSMGAVGGHCGHRLMNKEEEVI